MVHCSRFCCCTFLCKQGFLQHISIGSVPPTELAAQALIYEAQKGQQCQPATQLEGCSDEKTSLEAKVRNENAAGCSTAAPAEGADPFNSIELACRAPEGMHEAAASCAGRVSAWGITRPLCSKRPVSTGSRPVHIHMFFRTPVTLRDIVHHQRSHQGASAVGHAGSEQVQSDHRGP